jgi:hypothetical protein
LLQFWRTAANASLARGELGTDGRPMAGTLARRRGHASVGGPPLGIYMVGQDWRWRTLSKARTCEPLGEQGFCRRAPAGVRRPFLFLVLLLFLLLLLSFGEKGGGIGVGTAHRAVESPSSLSSRFSLPESLPVLATAIGDRSPWNGDLLQLLGPLANHWYPSPTTGG